MAQHSNVNIVIKSRLPATVVQCYDSAGMYVIPRIILLYSHCTKYVNGKFCLLHIDSTPTVIRHIWRLNVINSFWQYIYECIIDDRLLKIVVEPRRSFGITILLLFVLPRHQWLLASASPMEVKHRAGRVHRIVLIFTPVDPVAPQRDRLAANLLDFGHLVKGELLLPLIGYGSGVSGTDSSVFF